MQIRHAWRLLLTSQVFAAVFGQVARAGRVEARPKWGDLGCGSQFFMMRVN